MKIAVDAERCVGGGQCVLAAPDLFDQDTDDGTVVVLAQPREDQEDDAELAARVCPAQVIDLVD